VEAFGIDLTTALESAAADPLEQGCLRLWECGGPTWDENQTLVELTEACPVPRFRSFLADEASVFALTTPGGYVRVGSCLGTKPPPNLTFSEPMGGDLGIQLVIGLEPGDYFFGSLFDFTLRALLEPAREVLGTPDVCDTLRPLEVAALNDVTLFFNPGFPAGDTAGESGDALLHLTDPAGALPTVVAACDGEVTASVCEGCDLETCSQACAPADPAGQVLETPSDPVVHMQTTPGSSAPVRVVLAFDF
jgi:hypothetical protein